MIYLKCIYIHSITCTVIEGKVNYKLLSITLRNVIEYTKLRNTFFSYPIPGSHVPLVYGFDKI